MIYRVKSRKTRINVPGLRFIRGGHVLMKKIVNNKEAERVIIVMIVGEGGGGDKIQRPRNIMHRRDVYPLFPTWFASTTKTGNTTVGIATTENFFNIPPEAENKKNL